MLAISTEVLAQSGVPASNNAPGSAGPPTPTPPAAAVPAAAAPPATPPPAMAPAPAAVPPAAPPAVPPAAPPQAAVPPAEQPPPGAYYVVPQPAQSRRPERPLVLDYLEGQPVPPGFTLMEKRRTGLIIGGGIMLGVSYGISLSIAAGEEYESPYGWLAVPVLGPIIASSQLDECSSDGDVVDCSDNSSERGFLMFDTLVQAAGATMLILGVAVHKKVLVQNIAFDVSVQPAFIANDGHGVELRSVF